MGSRKAELGYCTGLLHHFLDDILVVNGRKNTHRDKLYIESRGAKEGFCFFSKTLPSLGSAIDSALRTGQFTCPTGFRRYKRTALPSFLRGLLTQIFDDAGLILSDYSAAAISECRQLLYSFYKTKRAFKQEEIRLAIEKFRFNDEAGHIQFPVDELTTRVLDRANEFIRRLFNGFDPKDIVPSHGPGIVSSGEQPHEKMIFSTKYKEIHNEYPYYRYFYVNPAHVLSGADHYRARPVQASGVNKVLFVPKDSRGPRTIACEPLEYQWLQQGLRKELYSWIERHPLTRGFVNFSDQSINQEQARLASLGNGYVTVDMKDASDRVSAALVSRLFEGTSLLKPLMALRTSTSLLPDGSTMELKKYAAMGSALCFPVEAICFWSIARALQHENRVTSRIYVYGDDIIVTSALYELLRTWYPKFGLSINENKTSSTGFFRESCGSEYYQGHNITYIKARNLPSRHPEDIASLVEQSSQLWDRCYYRAAQFVESHIPMKLPILPKESPGLGFWLTRWTLPFKLKGLRWNSSYQRFEHRVPCLVGVTYSVTPSGTLREYGEYLRKVTIGWSPEFVSGSYGRRRVKIRRKVVSY